MADHDDGHPDRESARRFVHDDIKQRGHKDDAHGLEGRIERVEDREAELGPPDWYEQGGDPDEED